MHEMLSIVPDTSEALSIFIIIESQYKCFWTIEVYC